MDTILVKFLVTCFVCNLVGFTTAFPMRDASNARNKRSPANNFSLFGIKPISYAVQNPIRSAQQTFNSFGNLLTPAILTKNGNYEKSTEGQNFKTHTSSERNFNPDKSSITSSPDVLTSFKTAEQAAENDQKDESIVNRKDSAEVQPADNLRQKVKPRQDTHGNNGTVNIMEIDMSIVEAIFNDVKESTTEDTTIDYTTETGDYESTTFDDLLRIPSPVVASLLG